MLSVSSRDMYNILEAIMDDGGPLQCPSSSNGNDVGDSNDFAIHNWVKCIAGCIVEDACTSYKDVI